MEDMLIEEEDSDTSSVDSLKMGITEVIKGWEEFYRRRVKAVIVSGSRSKISVTLHPDVPKCPTCLQPLVEKDKKDGWFCTNEGCTRYLLVAVTGLTAEQVKKKIADGHLEV